MPVLATDLKYYQSLANDSLGLGISAQIVPTGLNLFFSDVDLDEATTGSVVYRCFYVKNESADSTLTEAKIYVATRTPSPSTTCELGLGTSGLNGTEQEITSETVAPVGVVFSTAGVEAPLNLPDLGPGDYHAIWIKRIVNPNAVGASNDFVTLAIGGDGGT